MSTSGGLCATGCFAGTGGGHRFGGGGLGGTLGTSLDFDSSAVSCTFRLSTRIIVGLLGIAGTLALRVLAELKSLNSVLLAEVVIVLLIMLSSQVEADIADHPSRYISRETFKI